ncbi:tripartite tricarboxylate transporter substrate binding protein BugE [Serpentinimonas maccroryi]|nr:tripartite tricarboxylate transporter substrate binding protein BugE [Serpentinimonas maccroryi]MCM2478576.1 tripartite tricarboxylate transporter substrate binding protein BugE [Serpentinimonas maccroryi]
MQRRSIIGWGASAALLAASGPSWARTYPTRPVRLIVPFAPGGPTDIVARMVSEPLSTLLGQPLVVENRAGAGGSIGAAEIARAAPDGYTLGVATVSTVAANPAFNPRTPYNPLTDFTPITNIAAAPSVFAVHPSFPGRDFESFMREVRRTPGRLSYATSGTGSINHILVELFEFETRTFLVHIPYRGTGPALVDVVAGHVPMIFSDLPSALPHIQAGRLVPIVVGAPQRVAQLPNVPTFAEVGLPRVNRMAFFGLHGPRGLPREVVERVHTSTMRALTDPALRRRIEDTALVIVGNTPEQFAEQTRLEFELYQGVVQRAGLRPD